MTMTDNEICRNYRAAKNKLEQIKILADMNCTTVDEIKKILISGGELVEEPQKSTRGKKLVVMPVSVLDALAHELDVLDVEIKQLQDTLKPLDDRYGEIENFIKTYGRE